MNITSWICRDAFILINRVLYKYNLHTFVLGHAANARAGMWVKLQFLFNSAAAYLGSTRNTTEFPGLSEIYLQTLMRALDTIEIFYWPLFPALLGKTGHPWFEGPRTEEIYVLPALDSTLKEEEETETCDQEHRARTYPTRRGVGWGSGVYSYWHVGGVRGRLR